MSKLSFRARQVDYTKPLPIYLNNDLPDLQDFAAINRSVPLMPTGMEKDEEAEHHLQRALSALQAFGATSSNEYAIPTPKVEIDNKMYDRIYNIECPKQKTYIRIQPFSNDYDYPDYDADYEDENWVNEKKKTLPKELLNQDLLLFFETIMDRLEKVTSHSNVLMSRDEAKIILMKEAMNDESNDLLNSISLSNTIVKQQQKYKEELEDFLLSIYEYWKAKRLKCNHPLTPIVLTDKSGVVTQPNNPYLVFRRRTEKMQTRKNRKNEEQSYEKMLILKRDLCRAQQILKLIKKRENFKKEFLKLTLETFEKRYKLNDYDGTITESIAGSLKPVNTTLPHHHHNHNQQNSLNTLLNNSFNKNSQPNDKNNNSSNLSSIDNKTIVSLINSNKNKLLGSPPQSSLNSKLNKLPQFKEIDSIYKSNNNSSLNSSLNSKLCKQSSEKQQKRFKKEKLQQHTSVPQQQNTISNIINSNNKTYYGDLIESKLDKQITVNNSNNNSNNNKVPLTNRSNSNLSILNEMRRNRKLNSTSGNDNRCLLNENENLDSNNNKNSRNLNLNSMNNLKQPQQQLQQKTDTETLTNRLLSEDEHFNALFNEIKEYEEELRQNQLENLDTILYEVKNRLSTTNDKDGYWCFTRKEGCKYLPQNGPIFKNDVLDTEDFLKPSPPHQPSHLVINSTTTDTTTTTISNMNTDEIVNTTNNNNNNNSNSNFYPNNKKQKRLELKKKDRLKEIQQFYYGYAITKHNRHLGLVRRRLGRGGRILLDKYNENLFDTNNKKQFQPSQIHLNKFKTYYPIECFNLAESTNSDSATVSNESNKTKLKLKNFYSDSSPTMNTDDLISDKKLIENNQDEFTFDHRLFSLYQSDYDYLLNNELTLNIQNDVDSIITNTRNEDVVPSTSTIIPSSTNTSDESEQTKLITTSNISNDYDLLEYENCNYFNGYKLNGEINNKIYDRTNLIRYDFSASTKLNDEYNSSSDECNLNLSNVKLAIKTLKILNKQSTINESESVEMPPEPPSSTLPQTELTIETHKEESIEPIIIDPEISSNIDVKQQNDDLVTTKTNDEDYKKNLGESIANIASTTLTPPSPSPPLPIIQTNDCSNSNNLFYNKIEANTNVSQISNNNEEIKINNNNDSINNNLNENSNDINTTTPSLTNTTNNNNNSLNLNFAITNNNQTIINTNNNTNTNKILVSLPNNLTTTTTSSTITTSSSLFNPNQTSRYFQPINKIKNLNEKIMQPLLNGTTTATTSSTTSSSSSPSSSLSPQAYQMKKPVKLNSTPSTNSTKGSSFIYSTSSLPSSSSQSSSSSSSSSPQSLSTNVITLSTKLQPTSTANLVSINSIQTTNSNQTNSPNTSNNTIVVNGVLTKKKDENNPFILNNNSNYQNFHHQETSNSTQTNQALNSAPNGLITAQKLLHFSTNLPNSSSISSGIINSNTLFKQQTNNSNAASIIQTPLQLPIALTSSNSTNTSTSNTNDLNNSTKII